MGVKSYHFMMLPLLAYDLPTSFEVIQKDSVDIFFNLLLLLFLLLFLLLLLLLLWLIVRFIDNDDKQLLIQRNFFNQW